MGRLPVYITVCAALAVLPALFSTPVSADPALLNRCADAGLSYEDRVQACVDYADAVGSDEALSIAFAFRAVAANNAGLPGVAFVDADRALELQPHNWLAKAARGWAFLEVGRFDEARSDFYDVGRYDSDRARLESNLGLSAMAWEFDSFALTRQLADDVIETDPTHVHALYLRGAATGALGEFDTAMKDAVTLIEAHPTDPTGYVLKGLLHHNRALRDEGESDYAAALQAYEKAMGVGNEPTASLLRRYSWLLATGPDDIRNPGRALELAERMMKQVGGVDRHVAAAHHTLAVALAVNGKLRDAEIEFDKVIEVFPSARSRLQKALAKAGYLKQTPSATLYELLGAIHACLKASCDALSVPLIYKTL